MTVYKVRIEETRACEILVEADDEYLAEVAADDLSVTTGDWDTIDVEVASVYETNPEKGDLVWTGGPEGEYKTWG